MSAEMAVNGGSCQKSMENGIQFISVSIGGLGRVPMCVQLRNKNTEQSIGTFTFRVCASSRNALPFAAKFVE